MKEKSLKEKVAEYNFYKGMLVASFSFGLVYVFSSLFILHFIFSVLALYNFVISLYSLSKASKLNLKFEVKDKLNKRVERGKNK